MRRWHYNVIWQHEDAKKTSSKTSHTSENAIVQEGPDRPVDADPEAAEPYILENDQEESGVSTPVWINGTYLVSCSVVEATMEPDMTMNCALTEPDSGTAVSSELGTEISYAAVDSNGVEIDAGTVQVGAGEALAVEFQIKATVVVGSSLSMKIGENGRDRDFTTGIAEAVDLFYGSGSKVAECLAEEKGPQLCLWESEAEAPTEPYQQVFFTSKKYNGFYNSGIVGADAECVKAAAEGELAGDWKAFLASSGESLANRVDNTSLILDLKGNIVANDLNSMLTEQLLSPVGFNQLGEAYDGSMGGSTAYYGLRENGSADTNFNCQGWVGNGNANLTDISNLDGSANLRTTECVTLVNHRMICITATPFE